MLTFDEWLKIYGQNIKMQLTPETVEEIESIHDIKLKDEIKKLYKIEYDKYVKGNTP